MPNKKALPNEAAPKAPAKRRDARAEQTAAKYDRRRLEYTESHRRQAKKREKTLGPPLDPKDLAGASQSATSVVRQTWEILAFYEEPPIKYVCSFFEDGTLNHDGFVGIWRQCGAAIVLEINGRYSQHWGVINGDEAAGSAKNIVGIEWTWTARRRGNE